MTRWRDSRTVLGERTRRTLADSRPYLALTAALDRAFSAPANSTLGRKLRKLHRHPEAFLMDSPLPLMDSAGLYLYRLLSLRDAGRVDTYDLPHRSMIGCSSGTSLGSLRALCADLGAETELLLLVPAHDAARVRALVDACPCPRLRAYVFADEQDPLSILEYGIARSYGEHALLVADLGRVRQGEPDDAFRRLRTAASHVHIDSESMLALRRCEHAKIRCGTADPGLVCALRKLATSIPAGSGARSPSQQHTEPADCYPPYAAIPLARPFAGQPATAHIVCWERRAFPPAAVPALVTVIMTVFNAEGSLDAALDSIVEQTHRELEVLVVDDCSTDGSHARLASRAAADARIRVLATPRNRGTYFAKNLALAQASGEFVTFQDADDISARNRIELQASALQSDPESIANHARYQRLDREGRDLWIDRASNRAAPITLMMRRKQALETIGFFDTVRIAADEEYLLRLQAAGRAVRLLPSVCYYALQADGSLTTSGIGAFSSDARGRRQVPQVRRDYRAAAQRWHREISSGRCSPMVEFPQKSRPFPAPSSILGAQGSDLV